MRSAILTSRPQNEGLGLFMSVALHVAVAGATYVSLPFLAKELPEETPIIMELVSIDDITAAPPRPAPPPEEVKPEPKPDPEPAKAAEVTPPQPDQMPPPPDQAPPKVEAKVEPPKPPPPKPKPKPKKDEWADLQSLVKDLEKTEAKKQQVAAAPTNDAAKVITPNLSDKATMSERDAIAAHIEACWRIDPGKEGIEDLSADVRVFINRDGSVQQAQIVDMGRYFGDSAFRTFANSARNAVLSCGNIPISPQRYDVFKEITFTFSPQGRIN